jgi:hypothetical protein
MMKRGILNKKGIMWRHLNSKIQLANRRMVKVLREEGKGYAKPLDLSQQGKKSIKTLAKLMLTLMELNVSLYDFFEGVIYEQLVKTKTKQNVVEIINSKDFLKML